MLHTSPLRQNPQKGKNSKTNTVINACTDLLGKVSSDGVDVGVGAVAVECDHRRVTQLDAHVGAHLVHLSDELADVLFVTTVIDDRPAHQRNLTAAATTD